MKRAIPINSDSSPYRLVSARWSYRDGNDLGVKILFVCGDKSYIGWAVDMFSGSIEKAMRGAL